MDITFDQIDSFRLDINKPLGKMRWVPPQPTEDALVLSLSENFKKNAQNHASELVVSTIQNQSLPIDILISQKAPLIKARNAIIDNPLKYFNPFYRPRIRMLDRLIDDIEEQIFNLERPDDFPTEIDLDKLIRETSSEVKACLELIRKK